MTLMNLFIPEDVKRKLKIAKRAERCLRKLKNQVGASSQKKQSWKHHIAAGMRQAPTKAEEELREALKQTSLYSSFQYQIGPYIVDFLVNGKLAVEVDGPVHETTKVYDAARDAVIHREGYDVARFTNTEVMSDVQSVINQITKLLR